jgi:hypothetical protein
MLFKTAVEPATLELLKSLQSRDYLRGFNLVGDTAFALDIGHRKSIDIDDVDLSGWPVLLKKPLLKWADVKKKLEKEVLRYLKELGQMDNKL